MNNDTLKNLGNLPLLANLSLSRVSTLNSRGIAAIATHTRVSALRLSNCVVSDNDLEPLAGMDSLKRFDLDNLRLITNDTIRNTLVKCKNLEDIVLLDLPLITDVGIIEFEHLSSLKNIVIKKCNGVTETGTWLYLSLMVLGPEQLKHRHQNSWIGYMNITFIDSV